MAPDSTDRGASPAPALPPELEARIAALERAAPDIDFDAAGWMWLGLFGIALPLVLLLIAW